ncbi:hypothetical protein ACIOHS_43845 [Streptomyces sp. NPDC088253]
MLKTFADALMSAEADALCNAFVWVDALTRRCRVRYTRRRCVRRQ